MRICDFNTGTAQITQAFTKLKERWAETADQWNDDARRQFEKTHLREIPPRLQQLLAAAQRLAEVLEKAERECEDTPEHD
jgi:hypothetical protein